jgi:hypothetical protein
MTWQPCEQVSVLRAFGEDHSTTFARTTVIPGGVGHTTRRLKVALIAQVTRSGSTFVRANYLTNLGGSHQRSLDGGRPMELADASKLSLQRVNALSARLPRPARRFAALRLFTGHAVDQDIATLHVFYWPRFGALQSGVPLLFRSGVIPWPSAIR